MLLFDPATLDAYIRAYATSGARSTDKLLPVHGKIAKDIARELSLQSMGYAVSAFGYSANGEKGKEISVPGLLYNKNSDITILEGAKPRGIIAAKFPVSNFAQNANNYFEGMMGETANLRLGGLAVGHVILLPYQMPYYKNAGSEQDKEISKIEKIANHQIDKYRKLVESKSIVAPDALLCSLVSYGIEDKYQSGLKQSKVSELILASNKPVSKILSEGELRESGFSSENVDFLVDHSDYGTFISAMVTSTISASE